MKYCRFLYETQIHYGTLEMRGGELWIVDLTPGPEEDLAYKLIHGRATSWRFRPSRCSFSSRRRPFSLRGA